MVYKFWATEIGYYPVVEIEANSEEAGREKYGKMILSGQVIADHSTDLEIIRE